MSDMMQVLSAIRGMTHEEYCSKFLDIKTEQQSINKMSLCETQMKLEEVYTRQMGLGRGVSMIVLKGRKIRCSTWAASRMWRQYWQNPGWSCLLAADTNDRANILFDMVKVFRDGMPTALIPQKEKSNQKVIRFSGWKSDIKIASANEGDGIGRGYTLGGVLATEYPYWTNKKEALSSIMSGFVRNSKSIIVIEGTANGRGYDEELYFAAKRGETDMEAVFIPWHELSEYRMKGVPLGNLDEEERTLVKVLKLDNDQLRWRRYAIVNKCGGSLDTFHQEFPSFDHEAYLSSGTPYFDSNAVNRGLSRAWAPMMCGRLHRENGKVHFEAINKGHVQVWEYPIENEEYLVSADVAGARTAAQRQNDQSVAYVWRVNPMRMVAAIKCRAYEDVFANDLMMIGDWYNHALLAPENNNVGHAVVLPLRDQYDNLYSMATQDRWYNHFTEYPGWKTDEVSRPIMLNQLHQIMREHPELVPDKDFWDEAAHFVRSKGGRVEAESGYHDDCVIAAAIGVAVWSQSKSLGTRVVSGSADDAPVHMGGNFIYDSDKKVVRMVTPFNRVKQHFVEGTNIVKAGAA